MYKRDTIIVSILFFGLLSVSILCDVNFNNDDVTNFITFVTVYLGFIMTTFAIMAENEEIKKLSFKKDPEDNYLMLSHRLANYFKFTFGFGLTLVIMLLFSNAFNIFFITSKGVLSLLVVMGYCSYLPIKLIFDIFLNRRVN